MNILILQCVSSSAESSTPNLHLTFCSRFLLAYGFPTGLPVVCLWCVYGLSMVCLWFVYVLSMVSICPDQSTRRNWTPIVDATNVPSRAKNVRCPKDIYLMAEEVLGMYIYIYMSINIYIYIYIYILPPPSPGPRVLPSALCRSRLSDFVAEIGVPYLCICIVVRRLLSRMFCG